MFSPKPNSALLIIGHGSTLNPDSSTPTQAHAATIRERGLFREVACAFWKEEPSMTEVWEMIESREIYVVPNFISEGYFCQQVLPRELRLGGPTTERDGRVIHYCDPVGIHPNMTRLLLQRADEVAPGVPRAQTSLIIVGHGTNLNENSTKAIQDQVRLIREGGHGFAEVMDAYMEEAPLVADWAKMTSAPNVVVVPFFIADGLHSYQDIPVLLGMESEPGAAASEREVFRHNPHHLQGKCLYYSSAIGTERHMAEVILDQVEAFDRKHSPKVEQGKVSDIAAALSRWLEGGNQRIGQVSVTRGARRGTFFLSHVEDGGRLEALMKRTSAMEACEIAKYDDQGAFRPLKTAPTLRHGWLLELATLQEVVLALDFFYPASLGMALAEEKRSLKPVPLRDLLGRQTGMYRFAKNITDEQAMEMIACHCDTRTKCLRRITWNLTVEQPLAGAATAKTASADEGAGIPLLCMEACNHIVSAARKIARENHEAREASQNSSEQAGKPASH